MNYRIIVIIIHWKSYREVKFVLFFWLFYWHIYHALYKKYEWNVMHSPCLMKCSQHNYWMVMEKVWELCITYSGLTTLAKYRETWLLPQRTWGRSEGLTASQKHVSTKMWGFFFTSFFLYLHLKCAFTDILLTLCSCLIVLYLFYYYYLIDFLLI